MPDHNKYHNGQSPSNGYSLNSNPLSSRSKQFDDSSEGEIDLKQLFYTLWNGKWIIVGCVLLFGFVGWSIAYFSTPIYQSEGSILINQTQSGLSGLSLGAGGGALGDILANSYGLGRGSTLDNELEVLRSRKLSSIIADSLIEERIMPNGKQYPLLFTEYPDDSTLASQDSVAARLREKLLFQRVETNASVIDIIFESPSPLEAGQVVNITIDKYKDLSNDENRESASSAGSFLETEIDTVKNNLRESEEQLRKFMNKNKLVEVDAQTQELITQMADLEARRQEARVKLVAANSAINQYENELNNIKPGLAEKYSEAVGPDISRLQYAKSELDVQKQQLLANNPGLTPSSPQLTEINRKIESYKSQISKLTDKLLNDNDRYIGFLNSEGGVAQSISDINQKLIQLKVEKKQYEAQIDVINKQLGSEENFFNDLPDNIIQLARLKRDVKVNEEIFLSLTKQYTETNFWKKSQVGLGQIIDSGYIPKKPSRPLTTLYILVGLILGGIFSVGYLFIKEVSNNVITGVSKLKGVNEKLLTVIPVINGDGAYKKIQNKTVSTDLVTFLDPNSAVAESYRRLENNLLYSGKDSRASSILITSSVKGEGKTTTVANLGVALSEAGFKTLIIDADFRQPALHTVFGLQRNPGIIETLEDNLDVNKIIQQTIVPNLFLLCAGKNPENAAAITRSQSFLNLLNTVGNQFDFILVDSSPFGINTDSAPLLETLDGVVVVTKFEKTTKIQLGQTLNQLYQLNANVLGTVLNAYNFSKSDDLNSANNYQNTYS